MSRRRRSRCLRCDGRLGRERERSYLAAGTPFCDRCACVRKELAFRSRDARTWLAGWRDRLQHLLQQQ